MSIVFEPFTDIDPVGTFTLSLRRPTPVFRDTGEQFTLAQHRPALTLGLDVKGTFALPYPRGTPVFVDGNVFELAQHRPRAYASAFVPPVINVAFLEQHRPIFTGTGVIGVMGSFALPVLRLKPNFRDSGNQFILPQRRPSVYANDFFADGALFAAYQSPGYISMLADSAQHLLDSTMSLSDDASATVLYTLGSTVVLRDTSITLAHVLERVTSKISLQDRLTIIFKLLVASGFKLTDTTAAHYLIALQVSDVLRISAGVSSRAHVLMAVASAIALHDVAVMIAKGVLASHVNLSAALQVQVAARLAALSKVAISAAATNSLTVSAIVRDTFKVSATASLTVRALLKLRDSLGIAATIAFGDTVYHAWVVNTRNKAFSEYQHWPFNSMCGPYEGSYYAAKADGIYKLGGDDDAGTDIKARIRLGLSNMGTGKLKNMPTMYLGLTADGEMKLRVITTSADGLKEEWWYPLKAQTAGSMREGRIKIGKGLKSVYFDFAIENLQGSKFALDVVELYPIILDRRVRN